jgi:hypothetical protein
MKIGVHIRFFTYFIVLITVLTVLTTLSVSSQENTEDNEGFTIVHIAENGHYRSDYYYLIEEEKLEIEVVVIEGGNIDVYVMTDNQYDNAYVGLDGNEPTSISYLDISKENVNEFDEDYVASENDLDDSYYDYERGDICVVIDNQNNNLTDSDAVPTGPVSVKLKIIKHDRDYDEFEDTFCLAGMVVIIVITGVIILVLYLSLKKPKNKGQVRYQSGTNQPQCSYYPPPHMYYQSTYYPYPPPPEGQYGPGEEKPKMKK